jgi:hypothetical protein
LISVSGAAAVEVLLNPTRAEAAMANEAARATKFGLFMVSAPVVLWVTGVVVNYNTRFLVVNQNFVKFHMTYGLCPAALCWWGASAGTPSDAGFR